MKRIFLIIIIVAMIVLTSACKDSKDEKVNPTALPEVETPDENRVKSDGSVMKDDEFDKIAGAFKPAGELYGERSDDAYNVDKKITINYDGDGRIMVINYLIEDKEYVHSYSYDDEAAILDIYTFCHGVTVAEKSIPYDDITLSDSVSIVDGYYVCYPNITE